VLIVNVTAKPGKITNVKTKFCNNIIFNDLECLRLRARYKERIRGSFTLKNVPYLFPKLEINVVGLEESGG
jgi:hypothetical protein